MVYQPLSEQAGRQDQSSNTTFGKKGQQAEGEVMKR